MKYKKKIKKREERIVVIHHCKYHFSMGQGSFRWHPNAVIIRSLSIFGGRTSHVVK